MPKPTYEPHRSNPYFIISDPTFPARAEFPGTAGKVDRSEEGKVIVTVSKRTIVLMHNDDDNDTMQGDITDRDFAHRVCVEIWNTLFLIPG